MNTVISLSALAVSFLAFFVASLALYVSLKSAKLSVSATKDSRITPEDAARIVRTGVSRIAKGSPSLFNA